MARPPTRLALVALALLTLPNAGCYDVIELPVDPPIILANQPGGGVPAGDPYAELGWYTDGVYAQLADGDALEVVYGVQGGTWTMPTIRTKGIASFATVECTLVTETGETVAQIRSKAKFFPKDGYLEVLGFPIPVWHLDDPQAPIDDLYNLMSTLDCTVTDSDDRSAGFVLELELIEG